MKKNRILITGSSGFIGTNLMEMFIESGHDVCGIDILNPRHVSHAPFFKNINILNIEQLKAEFLRFKPDIIVHLAARTDLDGVSLESYDVNISGTENVVLAIKSVDSVKKAIFASSMLVNKVGYTPINYLDYNPSSLYGLSKVMAEKIIRKFSPSDLEWVIIRPTSIWGPWFSVPYRNFFDLIIRGKYFTFGRSRASSIKTFGYVGNVVFQIDRLIHKMDSSLTGDVIYLGDSPPICIDEWANQISQQVNRGSICEVHYSIFYIAAKLGDFLRYFGIRFPLNSNRLHNMQTNNVIDLTKTYQLCGLPPYSVSEGIKKTITWMHSSK